MINCTAFLSAAAVISKLLFAGRRKNKKKVACRCKRLRELLNIKDHDLPVLRNMAVRNHFEHVDERLDEVLPSFTKGRLTALSVHEKEPDAGIVLKRFDPKKLTISFADKKISLADCISEILQVEAKIDAAFKKLHGPQFKLWA